MHTGIIKIAAHNTNYCSKDKWNGNFIKIFFV